MRSHPARRSLLLLLAPAVFVFVACSDGGSTEPLRLEPTDAQSATTVSESSSPLVRPPTPSDEPGTPEQRPEDASTGDVAIDDAGGIGDFCADHLSPAREILESAERTGSITPEDRAVVQATLDVALDYCTPDEYFEFQQELFDFVQPNRAVDSSTVTSGD